MHILKPLQVQIKDPAKLPDTTRNSMISLVRSPQNPSGRLLLGKTYDVYGISETQARSWSFLLVAETRELVWIDMEFCLQADPPAPEPIAEVVEAPADITGLTEQSEPKKKGRKPAPVDPSLEPAPF